MIAVPPEFVAGRTGTTTPLQEAAMKPAHALLMLLLLVATASLADEVDLWAEKRQALVGLIEKNVSATRHYIDKGSLDEKVMRAMGEVPRHLYVPESVRDAAYENRPLPIGHGQTISQPYIVALMTDLLEVRPGDRILEVGTGSGYQAAVLAHLGAEVYTLEIVAPLAAEAREKFARLPEGQKVTSRVGDGYYGWEEYAPFRGIIVTAAASHVPPPLLDQLENGGKMIIPVGSAFQTQQLLLLGKDERGGLTSRQVLPVAFVPLTGGRPPP